MISEVAWLDARSYVAIVLALGCLLVFSFVTLYLMSEWRNPGWYTRLGNQAALAIAVFMLGETLNRGWGAVLTVAFAHGYDIGVIESQYPVAFAGAIVCVVGILGKVRVFTPNRWGNWLWVCSGVFILTTAAIIVWFS